MTTKLAYAALIACLMGNAAAASATMSGAMDLCLDTSHTIPTRTQAFEDLGWERLSDDMRERAIFRDAMVLSTLSATDETTWNETAAWADDIAASSAISGATTLMAPEGNAFVRLAPNAVRLQTCLYLGDDTDLGPVIEVLDGSFLRTIGPMTRIRGDGPKSSITAHLAELAELGEMAEPPTLSATFTVVLDRQPGDV